MERNNNRKRLLRVGTVVGAGGLTIVAFLGPNVMGDSSSDNDKVAVTNTFTFPNGDKCVDGHFESAHGGTVTGEYCSQTTVDNGSNITVNTDPDDSWNNFRISKVLECVDGRVKDIRSGKILPDQACNSSFTSLNVTNTVVNNN